MLGLHFSEALSNLFAAKLRSALAILGILVGTASVVAMVSSGKIATAEALKQFKALGTELMSVAIHPEGEDAQKQLALYTQEQAESLDQLAGVQLASPYSTTYLALHYQGQSIHGSLIGATNNLKDVIKIRVEQGRFISDLDGYQQYAVIGHKLYQDIMQKTHETPLHKEISIGPEVFSIIGILQPWPENTFFYQDINRSVLVSLPASRTLSKYSLIRNIVFRLDKNVDIDATKDKIQQAMSAQLPGIKFNFRSAKQIIASMQKQSRIFTLLLGLIGSISLLVGGIGVMNIMLVSVVERKREIGIRKALGARRKDIQTLFLIESVTLSLFGGFLGVFVGILTSYIIARFANWDFTIFLLPPLIGFLVSFAIGVFFGFYPAYKAARSDPIVCLRTD